jgi:hypothetical protein
LGDPPVAYAEIPDGPRGMRRLWEVILAMAERDFATAIHYHSWRDPRWRGAGPDADTALTYVVGGVAYSLGPPGPEMVPGFLAAARRLIAPSPLRRWADRALGRATVGRFQVDGPAGPAEWAGLCWSAGGRHGVDLYRVTRVPRLRFATEPWSESDTSRESR